jgi:hypothetical protein
MIAMCVRDDGALNRRGRVDVEIAARAVESGLANLDHPTILAHPLMRIGLSLEIGKAPFVNLGDAGERADVLGVLLHSGLETTYVLRKILHVPRQEFETHYNRFDPFVNVHCGSVPS